VGGKAHHSEKKGEALSGECSIHVSLRRGKRVAPKKVNFYLGKRLRNHEGRRALSLRKGVMPDLSSTLRFLGNDHIAVLEGGEEKGRPLFFLLFGKGEAAGASTLRALTQGPRRNDSLFSREKKAVLILPEGKNSSLNFLPRSSSGMRTRERFDKLRKKSRARTEEGSLVTSASGGTPPIRGRGDDPTTLLYPRRSVMLCARPGGSRPIPRRKGEDHLSYQSEGGDEGEGE